MNMYLISKKIHRLIALLTAMFILLMAGTGIMLKYSSFISTKFSFINLSLVRYLHNQLSPWFAIALATMMITGLCMYFYPLMRREKIQDSVAPSKNDNDLA